jgi:hypothetical protein
MSWGVSAASELASALTLFVSQSVLNAIYERTEIYCINKSVTTYYI